MTVAPAPSAEEFLINRTNNDREVGVGIIVVSPILSYQMDVFLLVQFSKIGNSHFFVSLDQSQHQTRLHRVRYCEEVDLEKSLTCSVGLENIRLKLKDCSVKVERQSIKKCSRLRTKQKVTRPLKERFILAKKFKFLSPNIKETYSERKRA